MIALVPLVITYWYFFFTDAMEDKDLIMGYAKLLEIGTYLCMRTRQTIVSNGG